MSTFDDLGRASTMQRSILSSGRNYESPGNLEEAAMENAGGKKPRRRVNGEASQLKILEAATDIAAERGYEGTSIGLVSARSGLPASSIYWHFKDKDALIAAVIDHSFESWLTSAVGGADDERDDDELTAMMRRTATALQASSDFLRLGLMLTLERREVEPTARRRFLDARAEALTRTVATYGHVFPELGDDALRRLGTFSMAVADGLFINSEIEGSTDDLVADFDLLAAAVRGVAEQLRAAGDREIKKPRRTGQI